MALNLPKFDIEAATNDRIINRYDRIIAKISTFGITDWSAICVKFPAAAEEIVLLKEEAKSRRSKGKWYPELIKDKQNV